MEANSKKQSKKKKPERMWNRRKSDVIVQYLCAFTYLLELYGSTLQNKYRIIRIKHVEIISLNPYTNYVHVQLINNI